MSIVFTCTNILEFDAVKQSYRQCGQQISVPPSEAGGRVRCPGCGDWTAVPAASSIAVAETVNPRAAVASGLVRESGTELAPDLLPDLDEQVTQDSSGFPSVGQLKFDAYDLNRKCPRCEQVLDKTGRCQNCKFGFPIRVPDQKIPVKEMETKSAGFSYWLEGFLGPKISIQLMVGAFYLLFGIAALMSLMAGIVIGGPLILLIAIGVAPFAAAFVYMSQYWIYSNSHPAVRLQFWQKIPWNYILWLARSSNWNRTEGKVLDLRDQPLYDEQIATYPAIGKAEVVDLEGTQLTDQGLLRLYEFRQIRCLIVRGTRVTDEGVFRIQQYNRRLWIWH